MKHFVTLVIAMFICLSVHPQETEKSQVQPPKKFFAGISYSYFSLDLDLTKMTRNSNWYGQDLGTTELSGEEIDEINSYSDHTTVMNSVNAEIGMYFMNKDDSKLYLNGSLLLGLASPSSTIYNTNSETKEYTFKSGLSKPSLGLNFNFGYLITPHWGVSLRPLMLTTFGKNSSITDNVNAIPENFTQSVEDKFITMYHRTGLMATFTAGPVEISAGPGFCYAYTMQKYTIERINQTNGDILKEEIKSDMTSESFIDGSIGVEWMIIPELTFRANAGIGNDIAVNTGIYFNF